MASRRPIPPISGIDRQFKAPTAYVAFFLALLATFSAWYFAGNFVQQETNLKFQTEVTEVRVLIQERLQIYMDALQGVQGLFWANPEATSQQWSAYIGGTNLRQKYPGIALISFVRALSKFEVHYVEPIKGSENLVGLDLGLDPVIRASLEKARDTGEVQATGLVNSIGNFKEKSSFMIFLPVYEKNVSLAGIAERRRAIQGFVWAAFDTHDLFSDILFGRYLNPGIDLEIFEENPNGERTLLYDDDAVRRTGTPESKKTLNAKVYLNVSDRVWSLYFYAKPQFGVESIDKFLPSFVLLGGFVLSFFLFGILHALSSSRQRAVRLAEDMTKDLRQSEAVLRLRDRAIAATSDGIIITDPNQLDNPIIYVNFGFEKLTGYTSEEVIGKNCRFLQGADTDPATAEKLRNAVKQKKECSVVIQNYRRNKEPFWNALSISPVFDAKGRLTHFVGVQRDVTELRRAEEAIIQTTEELKRSNKELEEFAYVASHDLQEPLRKVANYTELLAKRYKGKLDPTADKFIDYVVDGALRMQTLIRDLLTYSRAGREDTVFEPADFNVLLKEALINLETAIQDSRASVTWDPLPTLMANPLQMIQLLQNLIGNAIKYKGSDSPAVHVFARQDGNHWLFSVKDNGIGISPQYFDRIFVIFQRLHTRAEYKGTGIGLSICKKIVERHGGHIWVESAEGKGSTFYFTIPAGEL